MLSAKSLNVWISCDQQGGIRIAQINTVQMALNAHRLAQFGRAIGQFAPVVDMASPAQN